MEVVSKIEERKQKQGFKELLEHPCRVPLMVAVLTKGKGNSENHFEERLSRRKGKK